MRFLRCMDWYVCPEVFKAYVGQNQAFNLGAQIPRAGKNFKCIYFGFVVSALPLPLILVSEGFLSGVFKFQNQGFIAF
jgi:hypothetical protein